MSNDKSRVIRSLKGNSGCSIHLMSGDSLFVRKTATSTAYSERLEQQCTKQRQFHSSILKTPKVITYGYNSGHFYFDMEYVVGVKLSDYIYQNSISQVYPKLDAILEFIKANNTIEHQSTQTPIKEKLQSIQAHTEMRLAYESFEVDNVPVSYCHGDLTLENVIVAGDGSLYVIDFLDSYINSRLMDYSKLMQDLYLLWSWRSQTNVPLTKVVLLRDHLKESIDSVEFEKSYQLMRINLLRILPYIEKKSILYNTIHNFIFNNENTDHSSSRKV